MVCCWSNQCSDGNWNTCIERKKGLTLKILASALRNKKRSQCQASVAHACNPRYSGSRDQEDHGSKPALANSLREPISKNPLQKRSGGEAQDVGPEFKF
jgi:hypothetical protein